MRQIKTNFNKIVAVFVATFVVALTFSFLPRVFADEDYFAAVGSTIVYDAVDRTATIELKAQRAFTLRGIEGNFSVGDADEALLTSMTPSESLTDVTTNSTTTGKMYWKNVETGVTFVAGDVIWTATYTLADELAVGEYDLPISLDAYSFGSTDIYENEMMPASITVLGELLPQEISFAMPSMNKTWGDADFGVIADHPVGDGGVTYNSTDENVAIVNPNNGMVTIVGVGDTLIEATAAETSAYAEAKASYGLHVSKKTVNITGAEVSSKVYDGTTNAHLVGVTFDQDGLTYEATAEFDSPNVVSGNRATVTVNLTGVSDKHYVLASNTYVHPTAAISFFIFDDDDVFLDEDEFEFSGDTYCPEPVVRVKLDGEHYTTLERDEDYVLYYPTGCGYSVGTYTVSVGGRGNYITVPDGVTKTYTVNPYEITDSDISLAYGMIRYDGNPKTPKASVMIGGFEVDEAEYEVGYSSNVNPGMATVTVVAKADANITGSAEASFEIIDKEVLDISGISVQSVTYTGSPVELVGTLKVGANSDNIKVKDLTTVWYDADDNEIERPITAGSYKVVYSYDGVNYKGSLEVPFDITKAVSPKPTEAKAEFKVESGEALSAIPGVRTIGFDWVDPTTPVVVGVHNYAATYTYNGDTTNYTTLDLPISVYGLTRINIEASVDGDGGMVVAPITALEGESVEFEFDADDGYEIDKVLLNGIDVIASVKDNALTMTATDTDVNLVVKYHKVYHVIEGDGKSYDASKGQSATFRIDVDHALFATSGKVYVDGVLIGEGYYKHTAGSTVITLTKEFIATLSSGTHIIEVVFSDGGVAKASFTVLNFAKDGGDAIIVPDTGIFTASASAKVAGFTAIVISIVGLSIVLKKRFARTKIDFDKK